MNKSSAACVLLLALVSSLDGAPSASAPATSSRPAAASQPDATAQASILQTVKTWQEAVVNGDDDVLKLLFFDDGSKEAARAKTLLLSINSMTHYLKACDQAFGRNTTPLESIMDEQKKENARDLQGAVATIHADRAELKLSSGVVTLFVLRDGLWQVDFVGTFRLGKHAIPDQTMVDAEVAKGHIYEDLAADVRAHRYRTFAAATTAFDERMRALPSAQTDTPNVVALETNATQLQLVALRGSLVDFFSDNGRFPTTEEGLDALQRAPLALKGTWKGPYWKDTLKDPWGNPIVYENPGVTGKMDFAKLVMYSIGPDGKKGTADDIKIK
jgi:type II secretion system protein G